MRQALRFPLIYKLFAILLLVGLMPSSIGSHAPFIAYAQGDMPGIMMAPAGSARLQVGTCHLLTPAHTGEGGNPSLEPASSEGCDAGQYIVGEDITVTAAPAAGYNVGSWAGTIADLSTSTTNTVTMPDEPHTVTANYIPICYTLTLNHNGAGSDPTAEPDRSDECTVAGQYIVGEDITLTAVPDTGQAVTGWVGTDDDSSTASTNAVTMPAEPHTVTVNYGAVCYTLTRNFTGTGSAPTASPGNSPGCAAGKYTFGEAITMTAIPGANYTLGTWTGTNGPSSNIVTMPASNHTVIANYVPVCYALTRNFSGTGSAPTASPASSAGCPNGQYFAGSSITMTPHPGAGYGVGSWTGTNGASSNIVTMPASAHTVTANYVAICYTLTRSHNGTGGDPTAVPASSDTCDAGQYTVGETITMTASPGTGQTVESWGGTTNNASTSLTNTVSMPAANHTVTVNYEPACYTLARNFTGIGTPPTANPASSNGCPDGRYTFGQSITMTAHPANGYVVSSWGGTTNNSSTEGTNTVTMPAGNHTVTANYIAVCYTLTRTSTGTAAPSAPTASPPNSTGCSAGQYTVGESITVTANPPAGYSINGWDGTINDASTSTTNTVEMPASAHTVAVNYEAICYLLSKTHTGTGGNPTASPASSPGCPAEQYIVGQSITVTASPGMGQAVGSWVGTINDASTSTTNIVSMPASAHTVTVNYEPACYTLSRTFTSVGSAPTASPANSPSCPAGQYTWNQSITVTAHPGVGYRVKDWNGTTSNGSTNETNTVTMPAGNHTVTANYIANCYALTRAFTGVGSFPTASPTNSPSCSTGHYIVGQSITMTAHPGPGYHLSHWDGTNGNFNNKLTMPAEDRKVTAHYVVANDVWEPDNTPQQASTISSGTPQTHTIIPRTDLDWVKFTLTAISSVTLETAGPVVTDDTRMWLYNASLTELRFNDDKASSDPYSLIRVGCGAEALLPGTYYVKIDEWGNNNEIPSYTLALDVETCPPDRDTTGVFRPSNGLLYLKNRNVTGFADVEINYGIGGDYPVVGDWDGDGDVTIGIYRNGSFYLRNSNTIGFADKVFAFGQPGDQPVAGDWNGDGIDTIGVYRNGTFFLRNSNNAGAPQMIFGLGVPGDIGITGDWNGDGKDSTGVFRPSNGLLYLKHKNETGFADIEINYGIGGDHPVTGDWNNDGIDTIGVYRNGQFYLRNSNTIGFADIVFALGVPGDHPIAGNWDGLP